jgi:hypothetical protein
MSEGTALNARGIGRPASTRRNRFRWLVALVACASALVALPATADDDLPGRVGRVANLQGTLQHAPDENAGDWATIGLNYPIAQGDNLFVERDGLAEIDYGGGQFRLAGETNLHVARLDDRQLALFVAAGRVIVRVRVLDTDDSVRIDTPATQVALMRPGLYRIDVASGSPLTSVVVREGEAQVTTPAGVEIVMPGQAASLTGVENEAPVIRAGGGIDGFDTWSAARDRVYEAPRQNDYVSRQMIGQADLDAYGAWQSFPDYGAVWFPTVEPEWAPYRFGYWTWLSGWGYTWVDQAPWGYAPFHYGRWAYIAGRWGWCPGTFVARPLWAPALVAWYGGGTGLRGHGPVYGWVPLGWREPFVPWWNRCTDRCYARYNRPYAGQHRRASRRAADALCELARPGRPYRSARCHADGRRARRGQSDRRTLGCCGAARAPACLQARNAGAPGGAISRCVAATGVDARRRSRTGCAHCNPQPWRARARRTDGLRRGDAAGHACSARRRTGGGACDRCAGSRAATHRRRA